MGLAIDVINMCGPIASSKLHCQLQSKKTKVSCISITYKTRHFSFKVGYHHDTDGKWWSGNVSPVIAKVRLYHPFI